MQKLIFILGPTASGKSAVAAELASRINGEVISCDSMQVYRNMDIVNQAPEDEILSKVPHHLVKVISPEEEYSAARFVEDSQKCIDAVLSNGHIPVFAGGAGLYVKSLLDGLFEAPPKNREIRKKLGQIALEKGPEHLYSKLEKIDPVAARALHPNDERRIIRALEVFELTGTPISEKRAESRGIREDYDCISFGLRLSRQDLYDRINDRVEKMFKDGLVAEVMRLLERDLSLTAEKALGVKEISAFSKEGVSPDKAREELKKNTRRYAKRQMTWFRADKSIEWINAARPVEEIVGEILTRIKDEG